MTIERDFERVRQGHDADCNSLFHGSTCTCGFEAALSSIEQWGKALVEIFANLDREN